MFKPINAYQFYLKNTYKTKSNIRQKIFNITIPFKT